MHFTVASFVCAITGERMVDPVIDPEGNSYERSAIETWLSSNTTSPITRTPLSASDLVPNRALKDAIEQNAIEQRAIEQQAFSAEVPPPALLDSERTKIELRLAELPATTADADVVDVLVSVQPPAGIAATPTDVVCVIDTSGSMGTEATMKNADGGVESHGLSLLDVVKHAVKSIIASLKPCDRLSLVSYNSTARLVLALLEMDEEGKQKATIATEALCTSGMTNLWDGLHTGLEQVREAQEEAAGSSAPQRQASVLLLTDGLPNVVPPRGHLAMLRKYKDKHGLAHCTVSTFGFGYSLDSVLLEELAVEGFGGYGFIPDSSFVGTIFVHATANLRAQCAGSAQLQLEVDDSLAEIVSVGAGLSDEGESAVPHTLTSWGANVALAPLQFGQSTDFVLRLRRKPGAGADVDGLVCATCTYKSYVGASDSVGRVAAELCSLPPPDGVAADVALEGTVQRARVELVRAIAKAVDAAKRSEFDEAKETVESLKRLVSRARDSCPSARSDPRLADIEKDAGGQVAEAVSREDWFTRWGAHYLRSLSRAHALQVCNNFKDASVQHYGGALFSALRDEADEIFMKLPPPKPTAYRRGGGSRSSSVPAVRSMAAYNYSGNPCFDGGARVAMADGSLKPCAEIRKGDLVVAPHPLSLPGGGPSVGKEVAEVVCVVRTVCKDGMTDLVKLATDDNDEGLLVTPHHPVLAKESGRWAFPVDIAPDAVALRPCEAVYSFVLNRNHSMVIEGHRCIAMGHGIRTDDVLAHPYFGTEAVVRDLCGMDGWHEGMVELQSGCDSRDPASGEVVGLVQ